MTVEEAVKRAEEMEQYSYCYCASADDFAAVKLLAGVVREVKQETGVEFDHPGMKYVVLQMTRETWEKLNAS